MPRERIQRYTRSKEDVPCVSVGYGHGGRVGGIDVYVRVVVK